MKSLSYHHNEDYSKTIFGFWVYLLSDFVLFGALFATYAVLHTQAASGPSSADLFHSHPALIQTLILLTASFTSGLGKLFAHQTKKRALILCYALTFLLGIIFMYMGFSEAHDLVLKGASWKRSAFLSAFFTLTGTHMLHLIFALLWIIVLLIPLFKHELSSIHLKRFTCLTLFWQFINVVWIFIFSIVYLGAFS